MPLIAAFRIAPPFLLLLMIILAAALGSFDWTKIETNRSKAERQPQGIERLLKHQNNYDEDN